MTESKTDAAAPILTGGCLCGAVQYEVADAFEYAMNCHCSQCQRRTGSAFKPFAGIPRDRFRVVSGEKSISIYGDEFATHDGQCSLCGSLLYSVVRDGAYVHIPMGTLTGTPSIRPTAHIFTGSKAGWYSITDDLPQYDAFPED
ncbi:GFA family protein [Pararhizobium sp.]|uniref:GFA family protein n=1 Tax=Pararhizobium sp. TaxID=1977563 RepID=UPI00271C58FD|nr:GFA family protein [Pararhizobium sp.]MDO9418893.1 GFA family protein [Pararhizobium sp.]